MSTPVTVVQIVDLPPAQVVIVDEGDPDGVIDVTFIDAAPVDLTVIEDGESHLIEVQVPGMQGPPGPPGPAGDIESDLALIYAIAKL